MTTPMSDEDYLQAQHTMLTMLPLLIDIDFEGFLARASLSESLGPIIDPTLYRQGAVRLQNIKALAEAFGAVQEVAWRQLRDEMKALIEKPQGADFAHLTEMYAYARKNGWTDEGDGLAALIDSLTSSTDYTANVIDIDQAR